MEVAARPSRAASVGRLGASSPCPWRSLLRQTRGATRGQGKEGGFCLWPDGGAGRVVGRRWNGPGCSGPGGSGWEARVHICVEMPPARLSGLSRCCVFALNRDPPPVGQEIGAIVLRLKSVSMQLVVLEKLINAIQMIIDQTLTCVARSRLHILRLEPLRQKHNDGEWPGIGSRRSQAPYTLNSTDQNKAASVFT